MHPFRSDIHGDTLLLVPGAAAALLAVLAQRLVRRLCPQCKVAYTPSEGELAEAGVERGRFHGHTVYKAVGCPACLMTGYKGRTGIYEFLSVADEIRELVLKNVPANLVSRRARELGMRSLRDDGMRVVAEGRTSLDEVMRVTQIDVQGA